VRVVVAPLLLAVATAAPAASAAGFASAYFGGEHGNVVESNALGVYYNPGAIGFSQGTDIFVDGQLVVRQATWLHPAQPPDPNGPALPAGADFGNTGQARLLNVLGGPALAATHTFGNLAVGGGLFIPFGGQESWSTNPGASDPAFPLAAAGVQRWHIIDATLAFVYASVGAAYRIGPVSIGASGNLIFESESLTQAHNSSNVIDSTNEGRAHLDVSGTTGSFGVGALVEAIPGRLWAGLSYQAQPGLGPQALTGTSKYDQQGQHTEFQVEAHQALPDVIRAGVRYRADETLELRLFGDFTRWSAVTSQCVNIQGPNARCVVYPNGADASPPPHYVEDNVVRNWKDTVGVRAGVSYWATPDLELFAGAGFETGAVPDATIEPGAMDADSVRGSLGARLRVTKAIYAAASYTHLAFFDRNVTTSQLYSANGQDVRYPTQQQDGNGVYTQWIGMFDANLEASF
jgi:long-chain fatty acid transport protein